MAASRILHHRNRPAVPALLGGGLLFASAAVALLRSTAVHLPHAEPSPDREQQPIADDGRGRRAEKPQHIPARGWGDILSRTWRQFSEDRIPSVAAGVTFYALLALFPAIAAFVSVYGLVADQATIAQHVQSAKGVLPEGAIQVISDQVDRLASQGQSRLGLALFISLAISLWSANAGMKALFDALNIAYEEDEKRGFFKLNAVSLAFTLGAIVLLTLALVGLVVVPIVLNFFGLGPVFEILLRFGRWPLLLAAIAVALSVLYRYGPSRSSARWSWISWGSAAAGLLWLGASAAFSWYAANFGSYNETYGSLGAVIGFMTWIWISAMVVLAGAELNSEMEHQTAADTTTGPPKPMGARGARMADTVAPAPAD